MLVQEPRDEHAAEDSEWHPNRVVSGCALWGDGFDGEGGDVAATQDSQDTERDERDDEKGE